jgi:transposase
MIVRKAFRFRLNPTKKQIRALEEQLNECRWLYNECLSQRKLAYEDLELSVTIPNVIQESVLGCIQAAGVRRSQTTQY